jgi:hypothetical protein
VRRRVSLLAAAALVAASLTAPATPAGAAPMAGPVKASASAPVLPKGNPPKLTGHGPKGVVAPKGQPGSIGRRSLTGCSGACYSYDSISQDPVTPQAGISWNAVVSQPYVCGETDANCPQTHATDHSLMEVAPGSASTVSGQRNIVEWGWTVGGGSSGSHPHLFAFAWVAGTPLCFNGCGFLNVNATCAYATPCAGTDISADISTSGVTKSFAIQHYNAATCGCTGGWWTSYKGSFVGVFPDAVWTNPAVTNPTQCGSCTAQTFTSIDANTPAFGEVASQVLESCNDMGDGRLPLDANSGTISSLTWINPGGTVETTNFNGAIVTSSTNWAQTQLLSGSNVTGQRFGGPGYNSVGQASTAGYTGHCAGASERDPGTFGSLLTNREYCPDGATTTGCNAVIDLPYASDTVGVIHTLPANQQDIVQAWGKYGVSGKSYYLCASSACATTSRVLVTNASKVNVKAALSAYPHAYERAA